MTTQQVADKLVQLCREGKNIEAINTLYSSDIVSVEPTPMPNMPAEQKGTQAVLGKAKWWYDNHEVHSHSAVGPMVGGDHFAVKFHYDVTFKPANRRMQMTEMAFYTVKAGKIVREEFYYCGPGKPE
ncbi:MAG: nuclear transport factor 2 family protein [Phycisphaera sp.]|nr:nuclear transport factor 2 family protein [Phycisphaera sp.]